MQKDHLTIEQQEWRRHRAWALHEQDWWQKDIARALGVSEGAVSQWLKRGREGGVTAPRNPRQTEHRATRLSARIAGPWGGSVGLSWRRLDMPPDR